MDAVQWLGASLVMTALLWVPYVLERMARLGVMGALGNPDPSSPDPKPWASRASAAHTNAVENMVLFAPAVGVAFALGRHEDPLVVTAAVAYLVSRVLHYVVYTAGIPVARTLAFTAGWAATLAVLFGALR